MADMCYCSCAQTLRHGQATGLAFSCWTRHGGGGTSNDFGLAAAYATARLLRLADGPDEVHRNQIARLELRKHSNA